jgi:O-antigen/teichoic acid export membrane protein
MLLRQTILYMPSQLAGPAMQFVFAILWTHWLTQNDYGLLTFLIASQELIFLCCVSWWSLFMLRFFGGASGANARNLIGIEPGVLEVTCLPQVVLNLGILAYLGCLGDLHLVVASTAYVVGRSFVMYFGERVRTKANILLFTIAQIGSLAVGGLLGYVFVRYLEPSAASVLTGFAISHLVVALWLVGRLRIGRLGRRFDLDVFRRAVAFGLPLVLAGAINWINLNGIRVVTQEMGGQAALGLLAVGWGLGQRLSTTVAMLVTTAAFPLAAHKLESGARDSALRQMRGGGTMLVGLILPAAFGLWVIAPVFVDLLISEPFRAMTRTILPLAVATGAVRNIRVHYADMAFILFERTGLSVLVNGIEAIVMIAFCVGGYSWGGLPGAVLGAFVASSLAMIVGFVIAARLGLPVPLFDWARIAVAAAIMAFVLALFAGDFARLPAVLEIVAQALAGFVIYAIAIALLFPAVLRRFAERAAARFQPQISPHVPPRVEAARPKS